MGFNTVAGIATAQTDNGNFWNSFVYKSTLPTSISGRWADCSIGSGIPIYNAYVGTALEFAPLIGNKNASIYLGPETNQNKYVAMAQITTSAAAVPVSCTFCDYLGFYPLIDTDETGTQSLGNTQSLPRYESGEGVMAFAVVQIPQNSGGATGVTITYTNSDGVSGRVSTSSFFGSFNIGALCTVSNTSAVQNANSPFFPLADGDRGIRSIEDITVSTGIAGFINIVLCKPIFNIQLLEQGVASEKIFFKESGTMPELQPGAFLQFITLRGSSVTPVPFYAQLDFIWS